MALTLNKIGVTTGNTVEAYHVTQSIDAFTGEEAYDITLSGSLTVTGSVIVTSGLTGSLLGTATTASSTPNAIVTASVSSNTITFTKGNGTTFPITVNTGSGGGGGAAFPFTGSAGISGSILINSQLTLGVGSGAFYGGPTNNVALGKNNLQSNTSG
jgi:hypothetical protein